MKTYPLLDESEFKVGFEIENVYIGLGNIVKLISTIDKVKNVKRRRIFDFKKENHLEFDYCGDRFIVLEPFGDNSRYWIGPKEKPNKGIDISDIEKVFKSYQPPLLMRIFGDLISLNFKELFKV